ncbi:hypothetical protein SAMN05660912_02794 [Pseudomonas sp. LAMO17WK12:I1]|jgi:hypothetical protein|nr:hypothetical protein FX984_05799 [Pseudomonas marginalis]PUB46537.1 hypothetical protein C8K58_103400 [Pseudomonas sp. GV047]SMF31771.1 hypothetical protein SAMN05660912_02794 [Pseudomonas sp. LAMO17WK12:I1]
MVNAFALVLGILLVQWVGSLRVEEVSSGVGFA